MTILFHLGHPAHFHLFKLTIVKLQGMGHTVHILSKSKDVLTGLLDAAGFHYDNILPDGKTGGVTGMFTDLMKRGLRLVALCRQYRPDLLIGTSADISYAGKFLRIPSVIVNEDDASVVPLFAWLAYPWASAIISPDCCNNGRWGRKTVTYAGYHELAYLHPDHFMPDPSIARHYAGEEGRIFLLRFARLNAHHDRGIRGIDDTLALQLIERISPYGRVIITAERELDPSLEPFRVEVNPIDIHHLLAFSSLFIGDSQTMSAESAVLGTPYIRFNDFVGKIGYLNELEQKYQLGFGIRPDEPGRFLDKAEALASADPSGTHIFEERRRIMLSEKINVTNFLLDYIIRNKAVSDLD